MNTPMNKKKKSTPANTNKHLSSFRAHLDKQYGRPGTKKREQYEQSFETFRLGAMMHEMRTKKGLTQEALAEKCGTTKNYISRIENNSGDIRVSTLVRIIQEGFGGHLTFNVVF